MGSFQVKKMRLKYLPQVYSLHQDTFPSPANARYYETLRNEKESPFYVAINDDDEVLGYIATRLIKAKPFNPYLNEYKLPSLLVAAFATQKMEDNISEAEKIKSELLKALMVQVRIGGYELIQGDVRESNEASKKVFTEFGFSMKEQGKYKDGEVKQRYTYDFEIELISTEFSIERASYKHLNRIRMLHNEHLLAQKDYSYFSRILQRKGSVMIVVIDEYGRVVGYLAARRQHRKTDDKETPYTNLNFVSMAIDKTARGNKLGKAMVERLIIEAKESDIEVIKGNVRETNFHARKLYAELGFKETQVGNYKDTEEGKYLIRKRIRYPSIKPYIRPTLKNGSLVAIGYLIKSFQNK